MNSSRKSHKKYLGPIDAYTISLPEKSAPSVKNVTEISIRGPWKTKSDAELSVLFALPYQVVTTMFSYEQRELDKLSQDIRGLRTYTVKNIKPGKVGGGEFHRIRTELLFALKGEVEVTCEDLQGAIAASTLDQKKGILIPPFIMHTYRALSEADLLIIANTLYYTDDPETFDTYERKFFGTDSY